MKKLFALIVGLLGLILMKPFEIVGLLLVFILAGIKTGIGWGENIMDWITNELESD